MAKGLPWRMAKEGARVAVNGRKAEDVVATVDTIEAAGGEAMAAPADIAQSQQVRDMVAAVVAKYGTLDILVNNAAITPSSDASRKARTAFLQMVSTPGPKHSLEVTKNISDEEWNQIIAVNLTGAFYCMREALKVMEPKKYGKIINIASIAGVSGMSFHSPHYSASKAGLVGLTRPRWRWR